MEQQVPEDIFDQVPGFYSIAASLYRVNLQLYLGIIRQQGRGSDKLTGSNIINDIARLGDDSDVV